MGVLGDMSPFASSRLGVMGDIWPERYHFIIFWAMKCTFCIYHNNFRGNLKAGLKLLVIMEKKFKFKQFLTQYLHSTPYANNRNTKKRYFSLDVQIVFPRDEENQLEL